MGIRKGKGEEKGCQPGLGAVGQVEQVISRETIPGSLLATCPVISGLLLLKTMLSYHVLMPWEITLHHTCAEFLM